MSETNGQSISTALTLLSENIEGLTYCSHNFKCPKLYMHAVGMQHTRCINCIETGKIITIRKRLNHITIDVVIICPLQPSLSVSPCCWVQ